MEIVLATKNVHKLREFRAMFKALGHIDLLSLMNFPQFVDEEETGESFKEIATRKAQYAAQQLKKYVIADDSGLVVPAINGQPGIYSRRYAGADATDAENREKLLEAMRGLSDMERFAFFECGLALVDPNGILVKVVSGTSEGHILTTERGSNGFGYDSLFVKHDYDKTFAELDESTKNRVSHRRKAFEKLLPTLEGLGFNFMHYYIDGYNLMFRLLRAGDDLTAQREFIIRDISHKVSFLGIDATIVFDSQYQESESSRSHSDALIVCFTDHGQTADDYILDEIKASLHPQDEIVVTSDKRLAWRVRRRLGKTESVEEFITWLNHRYKKKIRQQREEKTHPIIPLKKEIKSKQPEKTASADQCFEFYLQQFEAEFTDLPPLEVEEVVMAETTVSSPKSKKKKAVKAYDPRTDMERWFDIFQQRMHDID